MTSTARLPGWLPGHTRTVRGPTDHVVIVGAGLAGLSAAMRLAGAGRRVTVLEREAFPGGRAGLVEVAAPGEPGGTYRIDPGPTVLTMPDLIADCFDALGEDMHEWLDLRPVVPLYRAFYPDGSTLDVRPQTEETAAQIATVCGPAEAAGFRRYVEFVSRLYRREMRDFIDRNIDTPLDLLTTNLLRLVAMGGFRRLAPKVGQYLKDPRTRRLFSFQALYAGLSPYQALAIYAVIAYMDSVAGVYFPRGGMHALPVAMAAAARRHGVEVRYRTRVAAVQHAGGRASAVITEDGERVAADVVVLNPDLPVARRDLLGEQPWSVRRLRFSPSCYLLLAGTTRSWNLPPTAPGAAGGPPGDPPAGVHHSIHFGRAWRGVFQELASGSVMSDPSFLVSRPTASDPALAPRGRDIHYVLFPTPNLQAGLDWTSLAPRYRDQVLRTLHEHGYHGFANSIEVERVITPLDWQAQGMAAGTPFAAAHSFTQTGPFRPGNLWGENVVFTGSGTQPGVGVPMVLISGRLAAERVLGRDGAYHSRAWR